MFDCQRGIDRKVIAKEKNKMEREQKKVRNYVAEFFFVSMSRKAVSYTRLYYFYLNI